MNKQINKYTKFSVYTLVDAFSDTQGQLVGTRKSLNGQGKNLGEEMSRRRVGAPGDKVLTDQF